MKTVTLTVTQKVTYTKTFEIPAGTFADIDDKLNTLRGYELSAYEDRIAETYIDFQDDWLDSDDTEITSFEVEP
jgi:hypothetical protein